MHRMLLSKFQEMDEKKHVCFLWNLEEFGHEKHKISFYDTLLQLHVLFWHSSHTWICTAEAHPSGWGGGVAAPNALLLHQVGFSFTYQFLGQLPKSPCHSSQHGKIHCKRQHPLCFTYSWKCCSCLQESASEAMRGSPLHSPLGKVKQGQGLVSPFWASKPPDWGLFSAQASSKSLLVKLWGKLARLPEVGKSPWFSSLLLQFWQRPLVAAEISLGWLEECDCATWLSSAYVH